MIYVLLEASDAPAADITTAHDEMKHHERSEAESTMRKSLDEHTAKMEQVSRNMWLERNV